MTDERRSGYVDLQARVTKLELGHSRIMGRLDDIVVELVGREYRDTLTGSVTHKGGMRGDIQTLRAYHENGGGLTKGQKLRIWLATLASFTAITVALISAYGG